MIRNSKKIRGGELLARALVEKGIEDVFTLSGGCCNPALEGFMNLQTKVVNCPHEQIAGHLADGHTRITRKPSVCIVGPEGFANAVPSMLEAWGERSPVIFITGSSSLKRQGSGGFKEIIEPIVKEYGISRKNIFANEFMYDSNGYINGINEESLLSHSDGKIRATKTLNLSNGGYVIGDGSTDLEIKTVEGVKAFICFTENVDRKAVSNKADYIASDFHEVIKIINCND